MLLLHSIFELIVPDYIGAVGASLDYRSTNTITVDLHPKLIEGIRSNTDCYLASILSDVAYGEGIIDSTIAIPSTNR
jgi:hypothetical protein